MKNCDKCKEPIEDEHNMTRVVGEDKYWHNDCYNFAAEEYGIDTNYLDDIEFELGNAWD